MELEHGLHDRPGLCLGGRIGRLLELADQRLDSRDRALNVAVGGCGADLGIHAAKAAIWGALSGKNDKAIEASIKPQTDKIQAAALKLCKRLPELLSSQQKLAAAMPEFRPYARMEQKDVDDCGKEMADKDGKKGFAVFSD